MIRTQYQATAIVLVRLCIPATAMPTPPVPDGPSLPVGPNASGKSVFR